MKIGQGGLIVMQLILMSLKISKNIYIFFMQQLFCDMCTGLGGSPKHLHLLLFFQALFIIASIRNVTEWVWAERFEQTAHLWGTEQKWTSSYIICSVNSHKDATTPSHYDDNTHILNIIVICVICLLLYTSNTISLSHTWMNDFYILYIIQGDHWKRRGGGVLFMIWLWLFMMGTTICALNNYRMILKASEGTIFPQSSNFNIKKEPTKQATANITTRPLHSKQHEWLHKIKQ